MEAVLEILILNMEVMEPKEITLYLQQLPVLAEDMVLTMAVMVARVVLQEEAAMVELHQHQATKEIILQ